MSIMPERYRCLLLNQIVVLFAETHEYLISGQIAGVLTFNMASAAEAEKIFALDATSGLITTTAPLDRETCNNYVITGW